MAHLKAPERDVGISLGPVAPSIAKPQRLLVKPSSRDASQKRARSGPLQPGTGERGQAAVGGEGVAVIPKNSQKECGGEEIFKEEAGGCTDGGGRVYTIRTAGTKAWRSLQDASFVRTKQQVRAPGNTLQATRRAPGGIKNPR